MESDARPDGFFGSNYFQIGGNCAAINSRRSSEAYKPKQTRSLSYFEIGAYRTGPKCCTTITTTITTTTTTTTTIFGQPP